MKNHSQKHFPQAKFDPEFGSSGGAGAQETMQRVSSHQLAYSITGLVIGLLVVIAGVVLFFAGVGGQTTWVVNLMGIESELTDAAPGAVLGVIGLLIVVVTRYEFIVTKKEK